MSLLSNFKYLRILIPPPFLKILRIKSVLFKLPSMFCYQWSFNFNFRGFSRSRIQNYEDFICICSVFVFAKKTTNLNFSQVFKPRKLFNYIHITFSRPECHNSHNWFKQIQTRKLFSQINIEHDLFIFYQSKMCGWFVATRVPFKSAIKTKQVPRRNPAESFSFHVQKPNCVLNFYASFFFLLSWFIEQ